MKERRNGQFARCRLWLAALLLLGTNAAAQLIPCGSGGAADAYKIYVDEIKSPNSTAADAESVRRIRGIRDILESNLKVSLGAKVVVRRCDNRFPTGIDDFDGEQLDSLENLRVLLEVWGVLQDSTQGQGSLGFVLVPARTFSSPAVYLVSTSRGTDLLAQTRKGLELRVFGPLALGMREYQNKRYEASIPLLCQGAHDLSTLLKRNGVTDAAARVDQETLLKQLTGVVDTAVKNARKDPTSKYQLLTPNAQNGFECPASGGSL
jgi:hypothetical protein